MINNAYWAVLMLAAGVAQAAPPADTIYRNGYVYTVDAHDSIGQALAVRGGRIVYVGDNAGAAPFAGKATQVVDLAGRMLMPGLIDGHMHPQSGGSRLLNCSLDYASMTVPQFQARIQACIDRDGAKGAGRWLVVVNWFQQGMLPDGVATSAATVPLPRRASATALRSMLCVITICESRCTSSAPACAATRNSVDWKS